MKPLMAYLVLWVVTLVLAVQVILVLYFLKPEVFSLVNHPVADQLANPVKHADSLLAAVDTLHGGQKDTTVSEKATPAVDVASEDSLKTLSERLNAEILKEASLEQKLAAQNGSVDSAQTKEIKGMAKMLESMSAEDAARILQELKLNEAKKVLMAVKKKQAGKILSAMEPRLAARMIR